VEERRLEFMENTSTEDLAVGVLASSQSLPPLVGVG
jgi:hypothetical protein